MKRSSIVRRSGLWALSLCSVLGTTGIGRAQGVVLRERASGLPTAPGVTDRFGEALSSDGNVHVVADLGNPDLSSSRGAALVFRRDASGLRFSQGLYPPASPTQAWISEVASGFGLVVVSDVFYFNADGSRGMLHLFEESGGGYAYSESIIPTSPSSPNSGFTRDVAVLSPNLIAVSRHGYDLGGENGTVDVLSRSSSSLGFQLAQSLTPRADFQSPFLTGFADSLDFHDGTLALGGGSGHVATYTMDSAGRFHPEALLEDPSFSIRSGFGESVAIEGDLLAVGDRRSPLQNSGGTAFGRVLVYRRLAGVWTLEQTLMASDRFTMAAGPTLSTRINSSFGKSVDVDRGRILVGAPQSRRDQAINSWQDYTLLKGSAYLFEFASGSWSETYRFWASDSSSESELGHDVSLEGDTVVATARWQEYGGRECGRVYGFSVPFGREYCDSPAINSTGSEVHLEVLGDRSIAVGDLSLRGRGLPPGAFVLPLASLGSGSVVQPGTSKGTLCLGGEIGRYVNLAMAADVNGQFDAQVQPFLLPRPASGLRVFLPGESVFFQLWYRDLSAAFDSNFSSAVSIELR